MPTTAAYQPKLKPEFVARALKLALPVNTARESAPAFTTVSTDSRKIEPGCLFIALKGDQFDGHDFIEAALQKGARGILCRRGTEVSPRQGVFIFPVDDPVAAYRTLAAAWRKEFAIPMIVVAGSVGKTTTKELLAAMLHGRFEQVLKTTGSQNGFVGIPMTLMELRASHGAAVIEVGIDDIGAMEQHIPLIGATASVLTAIGPEHLENLKDIPTVAREEGLALTAVASQGGAVAVNLDDPWIKPHFKTIRGGTKIGYTMRPDAAGEGILIGQLTPDANELQVTGMGLSNASFTLPLPGPHNAMNLLAAIAVCVGLGLTAEEVRKGLATFKGVSGRSELRELPGSTPVLCDYYNASPPSMRAGLALLDQVSKKGGSRKRRWACLGDMLELGTDEEKFHRELADALIDQGVEGVLLYGPRMRALEDELKSRGFQGQVRHFATHTELSRALFEEIRPGDAVLIKGSRGMRMEEIWKQLEPYARQHWKSA